MEKTGLSNYVYDNAGQQLTAASYNEVDALVFAELSYIRFEDVYPNGSYADKEDVYLRQYIDDALKVLQDTNYGGLSNKDDRANKIQLLESLRDSDRYKNCTISQMASSDGTDSQWAAMTININDGSDTGIVAMRGTDGTITGWDEDIQLLYNEEGTNAQKLAQQYFENCEAKNIFAAGHSKGGNDVVAGYVMADAATRSKIINIDNFDGPGVNEKFKTRYEEGYAELAEKLDNYYPQDSLIGKFLCDNPGLVHFVHCDVDGPFRDKLFLGEHDPFTWQTDGEMFVSDEQSIFSKMLNEATDGAVETLSQKERIELYNAMCGLQLPSLIAEESDALQEMNLIEAHKWLVEQRKKGNLTEEQIAMYYALFLCTKGSKIGSWVLLYDMLSDKQKAVLLKTIGLTVGSTIIYAQNNPEEVLEWGGKWGKELLYNMTIGKVVKKFNEAKTFIEEKSKELAQMIGDFAENIERQASSCWQTVQKFFFKTIRGRTGTAGGQANFLADTDVMQMLAEEWQAQYSALQACAQQVQNIANSVCWSTSVAYGWQVGRLADNVRGEARSCSRMADGLSQTAALYQRTERKITAEAGL